MRSCTAGCLTVAMLLATSPGWAQSATTTTTDTVTNTVTNTTATNTVTNTASVTATNPAMNPAANPTMNPAAATTGDFQRLSPGNQKIAQALFAAEHPATGGPTKLTLDQIAQLRETEGWGKVFRQMKADGLIQARNLGHVVSGYEHTLHSAGRTGSTTARAGAMVTTGRGAPMVITNGAGRSTVVTSTHASSGGKFASGGTHHAGGGSGNITTAAGSPPAAGGFAHGGGGGEHGGGHGR